MVHTGAMKAASKTVRQSVTLPERTAAQVRSLAKTRRLSSNRMLVELIENGIEAEKRKQREFFELAEKFRKADDPAEGKQLGEKLGRWFSVVHASHRTLGQSASQYFAAISLNEGGIVRSKY